MSSIDKKISQAKAKLLVEYPLFGTIASKLKLVKNDDIQAFKSDGISLEYNSDFFQTSSLGEMQFVFANGAMHASLAHEHRKNGRSGWLWQLATDYAINDMLVENEMDRPFQAHYSHRFHGLYAEEIYAELKEDMLRNELEYEADDANDVEDENAYNEVVLNQEELLFEEFAKATIDVQNKRDELPFSIARFFEVNKDGKIDWRDELRVALDRFHRDDYSLMPPNKKFLHLGIYLPSIVSKRFKLVVAVDSSGSVDEKLLSGFLSELNFLMNVISLYQIDLIICDDKIRLHKTFYNGDSLEVSVNGGGSTDFRPVFEFIDLELEDTKLLLYFTDLDGLFPETIPSYDVKWIVPKDINIPFGETIVLND